MLQDSSICLWKASLISSLWPKGDSTSDICGDTDQWIPPMIFLHSVRLHWGKIPRQSLSLILVDNNFIVCKTLAQLRNERQSYQWASKSCQTSWLTQNHSICFQMLNTTLQERDSGRDIFAISGPIQATKDLPRYGKELFSLVPIVLTTRLPASRSYYSISAEVWKISPFNYEWNPESRRQV